MIFVKERYVSIIIQLKKLPKTNKKNPQSKWLKQHGNLLVHLAENTEVIKVGG